MINRGTIIDSFKSAGGLHRHSPRSSDDRYCDGSHSHVFRHNGIIYHTYGKSVHEHKLGFGPDGRHYHFVRLLGESGKEFLSATRSNGAHCHDLATRTELHGQHQHEILMSNGDQIKSMTYMDILNSIVSNKENDEK